MLLLALITFTMQIFLIFNEELNIFENLPKNTKLVVRKADKDDPMT